MFTGIVTAIGTIENVEKRQDTRVTVACPFDPDGIDIGASIACSGVCLTVVELAGEAGAARIGFDVSDETLQRTVRAMWSEGRRLNLEPALRLGDELGGHLVTGHVDTVGEVVAARNVGGSTMLAIRISREFAPFVAEKGSITVDGVSLTVNDVRDRTDGSCDFALNIIPHTGEVTTLGSLKEGDTVNLEIDVLARYLKRMQSLQG
ncbi:riboflavin synthase [Qipengyuania psychrotolerans]|uniref:Riboflavin synthase n=1 Tax=Qipengyuania psychrotolerans TaxID=2867238 RepID=A0ABX8ZC36_9SPHN|nr:riboflavin synthase [Qipengyuania psychrotolerans]QZD86540.1 riboflavin synthase [Qipengyuania psychrotolerans]